MSKLSYETKIWIKCAPWYKQGMREQIFFFLKKSLNFPVNLYFASLLLCYQVDLWMVSLAQISPEAYKKVPQGQIWKRTYLGLPSLFDNAGPLCYGESIQQEMPKILTLQFVIQCLWNDFWTCWMKWVSVKTQKQKACLNALERQLDAWWIFISKEVKW